MSKLINCFVRSPPFMSNFIGAPPLKFNFVWDRVVKPVLSISFGGGWMISVGERLFFADTEHGVLLAALEAAWAKQVEAKGLKEPVKVLAEMRAEIAKVK